MIVRPSPKLFSKFSSVPRSREFSNLGLDHGGAFDRLGGRRSVHILQKFGVGWPIGHTVRLTAQAHQGI